MHNVKRLDFRWAVFGAAMVVALLWALTTNHVWEDFYITYRSSKNLATGHGLVFNAGDRLHTFTSPLGVLLPAAACYLTGTASDTAAIWVFRLWSMVAFAGAAVLVLAVAQRFRYGTLAAAALAAFAVLDGKSIDFSINGMETGFLLLFIAYTLWAMFACERRRWLHLGLAWGGLMWTRPDGFMYVGLLSAGVFFFNDPERTGLTRWEWIKLFLQAGAVCTAVYLPWIEWATWYYGSPVPHTIVAKGGVAPEAKTAWGVLKTLVDLPLKVWTGSTSLEGAFLPSYYQMGGWPKVAVGAARAVGLILAFQWVLPLWRVEVRVASFAFCGLHVYLTYFPFFPFPWYLPGTAFLAAVALGGMIAQLLAVAERGRAASAGTGWARWLKVAVLGGALIGLGAQGWLTWQMRREMALEEIYSATDTRRAAGEWLKANARPGDTVFMEPLGHIGYFSGLKTYDFPGLSSMEMVQAIRAVGTNWAYLIDYLSPDWLVLRPQEYERVRKSEPLLFGEGNAYALVRELDNLGPIRRVGVYGRAYVEFDAHLLIFHRQLGRPTLAPVGPIPLEALGFPGVEVGGQRLFKVPTKVSVSVPVPAGAKHLWIMYGVPPESDRSGPANEGVEFVLVLKSAGGRELERLLSHRLHPGQNARDREVQVYNATLPRLEKGAVLQLMVMPNPRAQTDGICWSEPEFIQ